uniref:Hydroxyproline-rich glycoprotein family protein n=2 Tax=Caenorhabditis tropicalis TaxID=1561998 RepID=A0A1I7UMD0_9PELO
MLSLSFCLFVRCVASKINLFLLNQAYRTPYTGDDHLPPTCSSSDEVVSPDLMLRGRNEFIGGSVRVPRRYDNSTPFLPPRAPLRNTPTTSSLRSRPPPPPYKTAPRTQYREDDSPSRRTIPSFEPIAHSTPNSSLLMTASPDRRVVAEGEKRDAVRDKDERIDKTLSYYENVQMPPPSENPNGSTIWLEYGCV